MVVGLDERAQQNLSHNLRVEAELLRVLDILDGLPVVVFKGPTLTRMIYGDLTSRASGDNDLWLEEAHRLEALKRLLEAGFVPHERKDPLRAFRQEGKVCLWPDSRRRGVSLDFHAHPFSPFYFDVAESTIADNLEWVDVQGVRLRSFNRPLAFAHQIAHFIHHHFEGFLLPHIGAAWDRWSHVLPQSELSELAQKTCSEEAVQYVFHLLKCHGYATVPFPTLCELPRHLLANERPWDSHSLKRKLLLLRLMPPGKIPRSAWNAVFLAQDELEYRYGAGGRASLLLRHLRYLLQH